MSFKESTSDKFTGAFGVHLNSKVVQCIGSASNICEYQVLTPTH
jgi:hypothetical protein